MMSFTRSFENPGTSVICTGVPLSQRFQGVPDRNPLRPNKNGPAKERNLNLSFDIPPDDSDSEENEVIVIRKKKKPFAFGAGKGNGGNRNVNKLAILRATKDAEILRLRAKLRTCKMKLITLSHRTTANPNGRNFLRSVQNVSMKRREGGGIKFKRNGRQLNFIGKQFVKGLNINPKKPGISPLNRKRKGASVGMNFFGEPRSKEALDQELDAYMAQTKTRQVTDLDKELDDYMAVARSQSLAVKLGKTVQSPVKDDLEEEDASMD